MAEMTTSFGEDKSQIGLTPEGDADRDFVRERLGLKDLQDAYRLGVVVALAKNLEPTAASLPRKTAYGSAVLDSDGSLKASVLAVRADHGNKPYSLIERLAEAGLRDLASYLNQGRPIRQYIAALIPVSEATDEHGG